MLHVVAGKRFLPHAMCNLRRMLVAFMALALPSLPLSLHRADAAMQQISLEELVASSDLVVVGEVVRLEGYWAGDVIRSKVTIDVSQVVLGDASASDGIEIDIVGGEVGEVGLLSSNQPRPMEGEEVILFLSASEGVYTVNGLAQGYGKIIDGVVPHFDQSLDALIDSVKKLRK